MNYKTEDWQYLEFQEGVISGHIMRETLNSQWQLIYDQIKQEDIKKQIKEFAELTTNNTLK